MTLAELALDVYRRLDYADAPPPSVRSRVEGFLNTHYIRLLSTDRMRPLRETTVNLQSVPGQSVYALPVAATARVQRVTDKTNRSELHTKPLEWYRTVNPIAHISGTPDTWVPTYHKAAEYTLTLHPTPSASLQYSVDIEHPIASMVTPEDTPALLPEDFHDLLALLARQDEYEFKSDDRWAPTKLQADRRLMELRQWVDNHDVYKRTAVPDINPASWQARDGTPGAGLAAGGGGSGPHTILSDTHTDTVAGTLSSGDLLAANGSGLLDRLPLGAPGDVLTVQTGRPTWVPKLAGAGTGDVVGPAGATPDHVAVYDGDTGKIIKESSALVTPDGNVIIYNRLNFGGVAGEPAIRRDAALGLGLEVGPSNDPLSFTSLKASELIASNRVVTEGGVWEHGRSVALGQFIMEPYDAANFYGYASMTWTVEPGDFAYVGYTLIGKLMFLSMQINTSSVGGTLSTQLVMKMPGGYVASHTVLGTACYIRNGPGGLQNGYLVAGQGSGLIGFAKMTETPYVASAHTTYVYANAVIPIIV